MWQRIAVRVALLPLIFVAVSAFSHFVLYGPFAQDLSAACSGGIGQCPPEIIEQAKERLGLNDPWPQQYGRWLADAARGDFGDSYVNLKPVMPEIADAIPHTAEILAIALVVSVAIAYVIALLHGNPSPSVRRSALAVAALLAAIPVVLSLALLIVLPARWWDYAPPLPFVSLADDPWRNLRLVGPPAVLLGLAMSAIVMIVTRLDMAAFRTWRLASAVGLAAVVALPVLAVLEFLFGVPGAGYEFAASILRADLSMLQAWSSILLTAAVGATLFIRMAVPPQRHDGIAERRPGRRDWVRDPLLVAGTILCVAFVAAAIIGPELNAHWYDADPRARFEAPSLDHVFGTNTFGQDVLGQTLVSARNALIFVAQVVGFGFVPAFVIAAFLAHRWREAVQPVREASAYLLAAPTFLFLALFIVAERFDYDDEPFIIAVSLFTFALGLHFGASGAADGDSFRSALMTRWPRALEGICWAAAFALLFSATVGFIGLGPRGRDPGDATFGRTIDSGVRTSLEHLHPLLAPGLTLTAIVFGFLLIALRLAAWRWEAERAPSSARSRTPP
jgi:ABC-type dipeptide/oligopeptide/nickel transport system permease component/ABC-type dipeptide/oligopeptide/nickel transport system permease subunit